MDSRPNKEIFEDQIEQYLTRVGSHLYGASRQAVNENLEEIRQHLYTSSEQFVAAGLPANQAVQSAIQRFGSSDKIGAGLARHLTLYGFPINVYRALQVCRYTEIAAGVFGSHQLLGLPVWAAVIISAGIYMIGLVVAEGQRFTVRSKSIPDFLRNIGRIQRESERVSIARIVNLPNRQFCLKLFILAFQGFMSIHYHASALCGLFMAIIVEYVLIRRTASRIGARISA